MNDTSPAAPVPPPLPRTPRHNFLGAVAFSIALLSAATLAGALYLWDQKNRYVENFPPGTFSGGSAFSLNFYPFVVTFASFAIGFVGGILLVASFGVAHSNRRPVWTFLHIGSSILLLPVVLVFFSVVYSFYQAGQEIDALR